MFTLDQMLVQETEEAEPLLGNFLRKGQVTILGGHGGQGKSTMALEMLKGTVTGGEFLGAKGEGFTAMFVDLEQGIGVAQRAVLKSFYPDGYEEGEPPHELAAELDLGEHAKRISWCDWREGAGPEGWGLMFDVIEELIVERHPDLVILDPVYKLMMGSKTSEEEVVGSLIHHIDSIRSRHTELAWLIPMHPRKPPSMGGNPCPNVSDLYGSALWGWWAGQIFLLQRTGGQGAVFRVGKDRMGQLMLGDWNLELRPGKGYWREPTDAVESGPRTPEGKVWDLLQRVAPKELTRKDLENALSMSDKQIIRATKKLVKAKEMHGQYQSLMVRDGANNTKFYSYAPTAGDAVVDSVKQAFDATEDD